MATFTSGPNGFDMTQLSQTAPTSYQNTPGVAEAVFANGDTETFTGNLDIRAGILTAGTATSFQHMTGPTVDYSVAGASIPFSVLYNYLPYGNTPPGGGGGYYAMPADVVTAAVVSNPATPAQLIQFSLAGHDTYVGSSATDVLVGQGGNDTFMGGSGTETFVTAAGNNTVSGGSGVDTVLFKGGRNDYTITNNGDGTITVTDSVANRNGTDHIVNVGQLQFADMTMFVANSDQANIARLYSAALDRAPDAPGLTGWEKIYANDVSSTAKGQGVFVSLAETDPTGLTASIAGGFTNSTEFQQKYGSLDDTGFVTQLYENVLGRAPDSAGINGWLGLMHNGDASGVHYTREMVLVGFAESAENIAKTGNSWLFTV